MTFEAFKMLDSDEVEVETSQILKRKRLRLRTVGRSVLPIELNVFESESPYVMIFIICISGTRSIRMDVQQDDLARELGLWLEGVTLENPALVTSPRVESVMQQFIKYGKTPAQEDLILWILSRSVLDIGRVDCIKFGCALLSNNIDNTGSSFDERPGNQTMHMDDDRSLFDSKGSPCSSPVLSRHTSSQPHMSLRGSTSSSITLTRDPFETFKLTRTLLGDNSILSELAAEKPRSRAGIRDGRSTRLHRSQLNALGGQMNDKC